MPRPAAEMGVILELEGVHKAGPSLIHCIIHSLMSTCVSGSVQCSFIVVIVMIMVDLLNVELVLGKGDG